MSYNESDMLHVNKLYRFPLYRVYLYPQFEEDWYIIILAHKNCQYSHLYLLNKIACLLGLTRQKTRKPGLIVCIILTNNSPFKYEL